MRFFLVWAWSFLLLSGLLINSQGEAKGGQDKDLGEVLSLGNSLPIYETPEEGSRRHEIGKFFRETAPPLPPVRNPAEWELMQGVLLRGVPFSVNAAVEMSEDVMVYILVSSHSEQQSLAQYLEDNGANMENIDFYIVPTNSIWTRDYGPWALFDGNREYGFSDHIYNRPRPADDTIPSYLAHQWGIPVYSLPLVHTGGNYMSDGRGTAMSTRLVYDENPSFTEHQVDSIMREYLGIERYIVWDYVQSGGIHHIDCTGKLLSPGKILMKEVPPSDSRYEAIEARVQYLKSIPSAWGRPYEVVRVPSPYGYAYTNSLIVNKKVYVPQYGGPLDDTVMTIYANAMPGYELVPVTGSFAEEWAIHCMTMGIPDSSMIFVCHTPLVDTDDTLNAYRIVAGIVPASLHNLILDSTLVHWRRDTLEPFSIIQMSPFGEGDSFEAYIPPQALGTTLYYYITAQDDHGKKATDPLVAPQWTYSFTISHDTLPPEIVHDPLGDQTVSSWPPLVEAIVRDDRGVSTATLEYFINDQEQPSIPMEQVEGTFLYQAFFSGTVEEGDSIHYRIKAVDTALDSNVSYLPDSGYFSFEIVQSIPVLVLELDETPITGTLVSGLLDSLGIPYDYRTTFPENLSPYEILFVPLGVYPNNHVLSVDEANTIVDFLENGGKVFMEGADAWAYDPNRGIYSPYFGIQGVSDGAADLYQVVGESGTFTEGMSFPYSGENNYMDHISPTGGAIQIFHNPSNGAGYGVSKDAGSYRTVGLSFELGGLVDGPFPSTRENLLKGILRFFGLNLPPEAFSLLEPAPGDTAWLPIEFDWEDAEDPGDTVLYRLYLSQSGDFHPDSTWIFDAIGESHFTLDSLPSYPFTKISLEMNAPMSSLLPKEKREGRRIGDRNPKKNQRVRMDVRERREILSETLSLYYWKVEALDTGGNSTFSREVFSFFLGLYVTGDANGDGIVDLNDLLYLASYLFNEGPPPDPLLRGDENGDCIVDSNDLVYLANYLFQSGPPPVRCITRVINKVKTSQ